jgi:hypothetical protein
MCLKCWETEHGNSDINREIIIEILEYQLWIYSAFVSGSGMHIDFVEDIQTG